MNPAQTPTFNPPPALAGQLIAQFSDPTLSLAHLAARHNISLETLALWIARPETSERLDHLHSIAITHTRYLSSLLVSRSIAALAGILDAAQADLNSDRHTQFGPSPTTPSSSPTTKPSSAPNSPSPISLAARPPELRQRTLETLCRTATRILQLSTYNPPRLFAPPQPPRAMQHPRSHAGASESPRPLAPPEPLSSAQTAPVAQSPRTHTPAMQYPRGHAGANEATHPPVPPESLPPPRTAPDSRSLRAHVKANTTAHPQPTPPLTSISTSLLPIPDLTTLLRSPPRSPASLLQTAGAAIPSLSSRSNEHWP